jgi:transketolase
MISSLNDLLTARILDLELPRFDVAAYSPCWLGMGSEGCGEQTIATDQDNGLVYIAPADADAAATARARLLAFAQAVNEALARCGYPLCQGKVMAMNPQWCLSLDEWRATFAHYREKHPVEAADYQRWMAGELPAGWDQDLPEFPADKGAVETRKASAAVFQVLSTRLGNLVGGSADLAGSTGIQQKGASAFGPGTSGNTVHWGVREHAMGAALNGLAAHGGIRPVGSTFLVFFDYMKPSIRLAALMGLPVVFVGTHDSIGVGEDGPTHQPIDHLAMLRAIPNLVTLRPGDAAEAREAWKVAVARRDGPTALVLTRQKVPTIDRTRFGSAAGVARGGYIVHEPSSAPRAIIIATGSELGVAMQAAEALGQERTPVRVVSLPSWELFAAQPQSWRDEVLPPGIPVRVAVEAASPMGWERWVGDAGAIVAMRSFGASAPGERLFTEFGFTAANVAARVRDLLAQRHP